MFASSSGSLAKRRGIVLVVVLGMLGLMALIGVTFATFAGQSLIGSRNFNQGVARPQAEVLMDYALAQLINDTNNPVSAIRGHSLLRDMYGNDSVFRGTNAPMNPVAELTGGLLSSLNLNGGISNLYFTGAVPRAQSTVSPTPTPFYNMIQYATNIPTGGQYYGLDFTRWIVRIAYGSVPQTFEVLEDDSTSAGVHLLTLSGNLTNPTYDPSFGNNAPLVSGDWASFIYFDPNNGFNPYNTSTVAPDRTVNPNPPYNYNKPYTNLVKEPTGGSLNNASFPFVLDGRYMRAFNGPGLTQPDVSNTGVYPYNYAAYANFRLNNLFGPDNYGMDEDYDACDLENWFLALQSADGQVVIPSFHRPGILMATDWTLAATVAQTAKILRPRQIDNSPLFPPDPIPSQSTGLINYDIDNDGDGVTDSVWLDLGYSIQRDPGGKLYKPLFAFMVLGLNGRLPLNTVGNLHARAIGDKTNVTGAGQNTTLRASTLSSMNASNPATFVPPNSTTQIAQPGPANVVQSPDSSYFINNLSGVQGTQYTSQAYLDAPLWDHASHLGYSVNEINPKFALQNAPSNLYPAGSPNIYGGYPLYNSATGQFTGNNGSNQVFYSQYDNAGVSVALTQMRNLLTGTIPTSATLPNSVASPLPLASLNNNGTVNYSSLVYPQNQNSDLNVVVVNGKPWVLPNNVADYNDNMIAGQVARNAAPVAGRWGEPQGIPQVIGLPSLSNVFSYLTYPNYWFQSPIRAGKSFYPGSATDVMDDDYDALDPNLPFWTNYAGYGGNYQALNYNSPTGNGLLSYYYDSPSIPPAVPLAAASIAIAVGRYYPEQYDLYDPAGQISAPVERFRRYVTPIDVAGVGKVVDFMNRPNHDYDYGKGYDSNGRASYFRYYRPAGMPQEVRYPYGGAAYTPATNSAVGVFAGSTYPNTAYSPYLPGSPSEAINGHRFLMPQLFPVGQLGAANFVSRPDTYNNRYHGFQSMLTPNISTAYTVDEVAVMGAMPYDWNPIQPPIAPATTSAAVTTSFTPQVGDIPVGPAGSNQTVNLYSPMINPYYATDQAFGLYNPPVVTVPSAVNTSNGPNLGASGNPASATVTYPIPYAYYPPGPPPTNQPYSNSQSTPVTYPGAQVVNGYLGGSLSKDEADEMNVYVPNRYDMPFGPSDLEWLYRLQDVDGATLTSRLSQLAPISFLNPADGLTRRRLFSTDSWELNSFVYANDNPVPYAGVLGNPMFSNGILVNQNGYASTDHDFTYNSRFTPIANANLEGMNQVTSTSMNNGYANWITTEFLPNPTLPPQAFLLSNLNTPVGNTINEYYPNSANLPPKGSGPLVPGLPRSLDPSQTGLNMFQTNAFTNATSLTGSGLIQAVGAGSSVQVQTPSLSHRDRKINLNHPVPVSNDPAEPIRQKWCRETYQMLKAILPPASVDTPEELAALSQFVVNIMDFRDPDCTCTRFVNTDLEVTDALTLSKDPTNPTLAGSTLAAPLFDQGWDVSTSGVRYAQNPLPLGHFPYDPSIYSPDTTTGFLVQHGMEYSPLAISEVMAYQIEYFDTKAQSMQNNRRFFVELVNTLTTDQNGGTSGGTDSSAVPLNGWDMIVTPDAFGWGRPDPITGEVSTVAWPPLNPGTSSSLPATGPPITIGANPWAATPAPTVVPAGGNQRQPVTISTELGYTGWAALPRVSVPSMGVSGSASNFFLLANVNNPGGVTPSTLNVSANGTSSSDAEMTPISAGSATSGQGYVNGVIPDTILPTPAAMTATPTLPTSNQTLPAGAGNAMMFWVYLRRPANPFDTAALTPERPNREMVVVDSMRFLFTEGGATVVAGNTSNNTAGTNKLFSIERLQPFRGGHLIPTDTPVSTLLGNAAPGLNGNLIFQQRPASAYGYSEQSVPITTASTVSNTPNNQPIYVKLFGTTNYPPNSNYTVGTTAGTAQKVASGPAFTYNLDQNPATDGAPNDGPNSTTPGWAHMPFNDRDFTSVAELLLVPGCPPGLFTKQFIEESYPGNVASIVYNTTVTAGNPTTVTAAATYASGFDDRPYAAPNPATPGKYYGQYFGRIPVTYPLATDANMGRVNFPNQYGNVYVAPMSNATPPVAISGPSPAPPASLPPLPTFPYLPDNFYYSAASVAPPSSGNNAAFTQLPTEIGGWTGAGWYKMFEFFDVPSSAIGAIGTADQGNNYDWYRADIKPGLLNLNLIIDEEVFAGLFDDPRLNESLASVTSTIPFVVTQISGPTNTSIGYPDYNAGTGLVFGAYPMFPILSTSTPNALVSAIPMGGGGQTLASTGRGYVVRDANGLDYLNPPANPADPFPYQQVHGLKAAFSDFLKLRHGGSGFLFAHGGGATGSGPMGTLNVNGLLTVGSSLTPVAADRPFRSLSYPDINYTIMRPASLPPSPFTTVYNPPITSNNNNPYYYTYNLTPSPAPPAAAIPATYDAVGGTTASTQNSFANLVNLFTYQTSSNYPYIQLNPAIAPMNTGLVYPPATAVPQGTPYQYIGDPGLKNPYAPIQYVNQSSPANPPTNGPPATPGTLNLAPPYLNPNATTPAGLSQAPFPPPIPPVPPRRLIQIPDDDIASPAGVLGQYNPAVPNLAQTSIPELQAQAAQPFTNNQPTIDLSLSTLNDFGAATYSALGLATSPFFTPPSLVDSIRFVFAPDNYTPVFGQTLTPLSANVKANNYLGSGHGGFYSTNSTTDYRQHPLYRTEWLQKIMNLTTVRTHQFAVWITVGFFEVVKTGTPELGVPDVLGQELGLTAGKNTRYRSFFTLDRTKATGFNPYYPGNFRDCVTYRRRIE